MAIAISYLKSKTPLLLSLPKSLELRLYISRHLGAHTTRDIGETKEGMKKGGRFPYIISSMGDPQFLSSHPGAESYFRFSCSKESRISFSNVTVQLKALAII
ncbi:unnamed protein product [Prunus armeniaca]|uniref:Uncharacterized protein n=1 Tax=Prunus armeniaca TaxID=36596 RepID=A0A6J5WD98_PRUAR|nr:unnamed protein product [Prunus armeniaca]CAB4298025.1 unnamed protein product [Prunus armeniaca]